MVLVTGGSADSSSDWAINLADQVTTLGAINSIPHLDFNKIYITGKWDKLYNLAGTASQVSLATDILNAKIKNVPYSSNSSFGLYQDLSPSHAGIIADSAGAIVGDDLWYKDWTLPGTLDFRLGDDKIQHLHTQPAGGRDSASAVKLYKPLRWDFALFQKAPLNGALDVPACQAFQDGADVSHVFRSSILLFPALLANGDRVYKSLGHSGYMFGSTGVHRLRVILVLLTGEVIDETIYWEIVQ